MVRVLTFFFLSLTFRNAYAFDLVNFDRKSIVELKINEMYINVSKYELGKEPKNWGGACPVFVYKFDTNGNVVESGLARLNSRLGYQYDNSNKLVSWSWENKSTGELTVFTKDAFEDGIFEKDLARKESYLLGLIASKKDYRSPRKQSISDICASIDAEYYLELRESENGLPKTYKASKIKELENFPFGNLQSPRELYINYEYIFFND